MHVCMEVKHQQRAIMRGAKEECPDEVIVVWVVHSQDFHLVGWGLSPV